MTCQGVPELQQSHPHRTLAREDLALHKGGRSQRASLWPLGSAFGWSPVEVTRILPPLFASWPLQIH